MADESHGDDLEQTRAVFREARESVQDSSRFVTSRSQAVRLHRARLGLLLLLAIVTLVVIFGVWVLFRPGGPSSGDAGRAEAPTVGSTTGANSGSGDTGAAVADCLVPATALSVSTTNVEIARGKRDSSMYVMTWDVTVTNTGPDPILVSFSRLDTSANSSGGGWQEGATPVSPGQTLTLPVNSIDNNTSARAGAVEEIYVDRVLAVKDTAECASAGQAPALQTNAIPVPAPTPPQ